MSEISAAEAQFIDCVVDQDFLDEVFGMLFIQGVDPAEALRRCGGRPETARHRGHDEIRALAQETNADYEPRPIAFVVPLRGWSLVTGSWLVAEEDRVAAASRGSQSIGVMRHDYAASHAFSYAVDGELITAFPPEALWRRYGVDADRLAPHAEAVGLSLADDAETPDRPIAAVLLLAARLTGQLPTLTDFEGSLLSADVA